MDNSNNNNTNSNFQKSIWKHVQDENGDDWKMFFDCNPKDKVPVSKTTNSESQIKLISTNTKKNIILGTLVMTPSGLGRLIKQDKTISTIKLIKTNEDVNFEEDDVLMFFPIYIRIIEKDFSNWHKISVPANGSIISIRKTLEERKVIEKDKTFNLIFNGSDTKEETFFDQMPELLPNSKFLLFGLKNNLCKLSRFTTINSWWYTYAIDGISFCVNKSIRLTGVGLYGSHEGKIQSGTITLHEGSSNLGSFGGIYLLSELIEVPASPNQSEPLTPIYFKKPVSIKQGVDYTIQFQCSTYCYFYYGSQGSAKAIGDKNVEFEFKFTNNSNHGSNVDSGNFPEFYYYA
jgi:hypothetical protein